MLRPSARGFAVAAALTALLLLPAAVTAQGAPQQPTQPATGPGGAEYAYDDVLAGHFGPEPDGTAEPNGYWIFEPAASNDSTPIADQALPLVLFVHGFGAVDPEWYRAWIDHLVRRGVIVVYPDYHTTAVAATLETLGPVGDASPPHVRAAMRAALTELEQGNHAQPDLERFAVVGHSLGATLAADYAGTAATEGLPVPVALMAAQPGCGGCDLTVAAGIPETTHVLIVAGDADTIVGEEPARRLWANLTGVPADRRDYVWLRSDDHGQPPLVADHFVALTSGFAEAYIDAADWYGTWKLTDALMGCAFAGEWCDHALGNTPEQRFMGTWSDGVPVTEAEILPEG